MIDKHSGEGFSGSYEKCSNIKLGEGGRLEVMSPLRLNTASGNLELKWLGGDIKISEDESLKGKKISKNENI